MEFAQTKQKSLQRGQKCCQRLDSSFHYLSKCSVNCLDKSEQRGVPTDRTPPARTEVLSARGEESKPVAHPCRGPGGQAGDHRQRQGHPLSGTREPWLAPNVLLATVLPPHAPRLTPHDLRGPPSMPGAELGTVLLTRTGGNMLRNDTFSGFLQKFDKLSFRSNFIFSINLRRFLS